MPRTAVSYSNLLPNSSIADPTPVTIDSTLVTNGVKIANAVPEETLIRVTNTAGTDKVVTLAAGDMPPAFAAGQGALTGTVTATTGVRWFGPFEGARFLQNDGSLEIDLAAGLTGAITVFRVPRTA